MALKMPTTAIIINTTNIEMTAIYLINYRKKSKLRDAKGRKDTLHNETALCGQEFIEYLVIENIH